MRAAATLLLSLPDDDVSCVLAALPGDVVPACARTCSRLRRLADDEELWRRAMARFVGDVTHPSAVVAAPFATWKELFRLCFCTLQHSVSGLFACGRAYCGGEGLALPFGQYVPRAPVVRPSYHLQMPDHLVDLLSVTVESSSRPFASCRGGAPGPPSDVVIYPPLMAPPGVEGIHARIVRERGSARRLQHRDFHLAVNGPDEERSTGASSFPTLHKFSPFVCTTSAPRDEGARIVLHLGRPCLLTGAVVCNPGPLNRFPVREAAVYVGMTVAEASARRDAFVRITFPRATHVNAEASAFAPPALARFAVVHLVSAFDEAGLCPPDVACFDVRAVGVYGTELRDVRFS